MKRAYRILAVLTALLFAAEGVVLSMLPDTVPVHYNFAGEVDRMGSKLEFLLFPAIAAVCGVIFTLAARHCGKKGDRDSVLQEKIMLGAAFADVVLFGGLGLYVMVLAARYTPGDAGPAVTADLPRLIVTGVGLLLVLLGNAMPKARRNTLFGLRTKWSMADDEAWRKSQRFGGFSAVGLGFALIASGMLLSGLPLLILCAASGPVWAGLCVAASYRFYKECKEVS